MKNRDYRLNCCLKKNSIIPALRILALCGLCLAVLLSCGEEPQEENTFFPPMEEEEYASQDFTYMPADQNRPFEHIDVAPRFASVDPEHADTAWFMDGTSIEIPEDALVFEDGTPCTSPVQISFTEYDSPANIIASGINMTCMEDGKVVPFISSGMFKVEASSNGRNVKVRDGKELTVNLATYNGDEGYAEWVLDEKTNQWSQVGMSEAVPNTLENQLRAAGESQMEQMDRSVVVLNLGDRSRQSLSGMAWRTSSPLPKEKWQLITGRKWDYCKVKTDSTEGDGWRVELISSDKMVSFTGVPALPKGKGMGGRFSSALTLASSNGKLANLPVQNSFIRSMRVPGFGTFNCDIKSREETMDLPLVITDQGKPVEEATAFLICPEINGTINFSGSHLGEFFTFPGKRCVLLVTGKDGKYDLRELDVHAVSQARKTGKYPVDWNPRKLKNIEELVDVMSTIS